VGGVLVQHEGSVGPYKYVQLHANDAQSLLQWLPDNGYTIPADVKPIIEAYQSEGFDFIALRLAPNMQTKQMTPVRVITPGASPTLPLRMVTAGTGDFVGITLYVIAEGRYEAAGFNNKVNVDYSLLSWDWHNSFDTTQGESNYAALRLQALAAGDGRNWLTSFASHPGFIQTYTDSLGAPINFAINDGSSSRFMPPSTVDNFADLYFSQAGADTGSLGTCMGRSPIMSGKLAENLEIYDNLCPPVDRDAGVATGTEAGADRDAGVSPCSTAVPSGKQGASTLVCGNFTDVATALIGMHPQDVWITRLEANLPHAALAADLKLAPAADQKEVSSAHRAVSHVNPPCDLLQNHDVEITSKNDISSSARTQQAGASAFAALGLLVARRAARRRAGRR
jgi:hypothetical protein